MAQQPSSHDRRRAPATGPLLFAALVTLLTLALGGTALATRARTALPAQAPGEEPAALVFLAQVLRDHDGRGAGDVPTAAPPSAEPTVPASATPAPAPSATPAGPPPTAAPPVCRGPLDTRVGVRPIDIGEARVALPDGSGFSNTRPIYLDPFDGRRALVAWSDTEGQVRFTPLLGLGRRDGADIVVPGDTARGLVAHEDGSFTALIGRGRRMVMLSFDAQGQLAWERDLVGAEGGGAGAKWIDDWGHESRLVWTGTRYAAYFGHTQNFGADGRHQGDLLWILRRDGSRVESPEPPLVSWDWGCSHSLDLRLRVQPERGALGPVCLSDGYPNNGIVFSNAYTISYEPSGDGNGHSDARLGGVAPLEDGFAVSYASNVGRGGVLDVALTRIYEDGEVGPPWWLTDTPDIEESSPHLEGYGDDLLAAWRSEGRLLGALVDTRGQIREGPVPLGADVGERDDFVSYPNGDVTWAYRNAAGDQLFHAIVQHCRP